jgi:hypothetical protein
MDGRTAPTFGLCYDFRQRIPFSQDHHTFYAECLAEIEFEAFRRDLRHRPSLLEEGVTVIRQAWERGRTGFAGRRWSFLDLPFEPRPGRRIALRGPCREPERGRGRPGVFMAGRGVRLG